MCKFNRTRAVNLVNKRYKGHAFCYINYSFQKPNLKFATDLKKNVIFKKNV